MTRREAAIVLAVIVTAGGGCSECVRNQIAALVARLPDVDWLTAAEHMPGPRVLDDFDPKNVVVERRVDVDELQAMIFAAHAGLLYSTLTPAPAYLEAKDG